MVRLVIGREGMGANLRALLVSYSFPPVGGAGVQRVLKLAKYLPDHGVVPSVLTVSNPSVPVLDRSLEAELPAGLEVLRARTLEPGYAMKQAAWTASAQGPGGGGAARTPSVAKRLVRSGAQIAKQLLVPDPQILWQPAAQAMLAKRLFGPERDDVVFVSAPPFSQFLLAPLARLRSGVGVVLDYRDEWSTYRTTYEMMGARLANAIGDPLERELLRAADMVTTATPEFRENLLARFSFLDPARVVAIPNGYDPDDFPEDLPEPPRDKFVLSYAGTVFKLTSVRGLLGAVRKLHEREPQLAKHLALRFMGRIVDTELDAFEGGEALGIERLGYVDHARVLRELSASHMVLCVLDDVPGTERIYPGKIFELMHLGRPVLTLSPEGALTRLVRDTELGPILPPRDEEAIAALLATALREHLGSTKRQSAADSLAHPATRAEKLARFHRRVTAGDFAAVMRAAVERRRTASKSAVP
jgi:glycosyltransferase involved in cell wall biosynthesis